ncbi:hypothetical protein FOPG_08062 [Fusarium oxysporum f. sp. conglutinans race 2 54008]|uniref:Uncharacterized protein n=3 Tax=Fusarium oxysporum TaxID=5507 RepID=A0A0J9UXQ5_FUSO4|nr:hypothetical protein FOXG_19179 [Fusarium oxysporum f. sp. lycopersici 4287]EXA00272.1 hypothetical protein FOWG_00557 [Fusarium oxysporum f. sp. lycopersici MN25]EXK33253.1 hypothetical protein FOMG_11987 [Fusarium oxysporum f. sp. melonis 26406]EXL77507.1 hypothetical protein FOPG_08062 [Fusarium oxysporum f. sp. conglutinans race 2 54008]KAI8413619.1 hypothetical protein FOFC_06900 [Fusarium oxysporum]KNB03673.1 hypothetical protein FOXG_19179 [Fusarium oxysporum f. sp. lycopersici 4287]
MSVSVRQRMDLSCLGQSDIAWSLPLRAFMLLKRSALGHNLAPAPET